MWALLHRLRQTTEIFSEYDAIIQTQLQQGVIECVKFPEEETHRVHYLPHHAVIRRNATTTKIRVVYDASAKSDGRPSLNDCLHTGPKFNQNILNLLLRFRVHRTALTVDIEKAFLMIQIANED